MNQENKSNNLSGNYQPPEYDHPATNYTKIGYENPMPSQDDNPQIITYDQPYAVPAKSLYDKPVAYDKPLIYDKPETYEMPLDYPPDGPNKSLQAFPDAMVECSSPVNPRMRDKFGWWWFTRDVRARARGSALYLTIVTFIFGDFYSVKYFPSEFAAEYIFTVFASIVMMSLSFMVYYGIKSKKPHMLIIWLFYTVPGSVGVAVYLLYLSSYVTSPFSPSIINYPWHAVPLFIIIILLFSMILPFPYFWWTIYVTYKSIKRELALVPVKTGGQPWFGPVFKSDDCSSCLMVEIGEKVRDYGQPCEVCGQNDSRDPVPARSYVWKLGPGIE